MTPTPTARFDPARCRRAVAVLFALVSGSAVVAQSPGEAVVGLREQVLQQRCRGEAAEWEVRVYRARLAAGVEGVQPTAGEVVQAVTNDLYVSYPPTRLMTLPPADRLDRERTARGQRWGEVMTERVKFQQAVDAGQQADGFDWATGSVATLRSDALDYSLLAVGAAAVAVGLWGTAHRLRVPWRRWRRARAMRAAVAVLTLASLAAATGCGSPPPSRPWAEAQREELTAKLAAATATADEAVAKADAARRGAVAQYGMPEAQLLALRDLLATTLAVEKLKAEAADEQAKLDADKVRLGELSRAGREQKGTWAVVRVGVGVLLLAVALTPFLVAVGWERARRKADADTCPRCLATGDMKERRGKVIECGRCGYRCQSNTKGMARLCFPTVGIRSSGKTHLLATAYASVKNRNTRTPATVQQAASMGDEQFNAYIELILKHRATAGATVHDLPAPIVVCARDADRGGPSTVLVNLFDYSGEMMTQAIAVDDLRRRAVRMDGFVMFFDPTQMYGDEVDGEATLALEDQLAALHQFYQDMLDARGLPPGRPVPVPVAVCISKFDLVATRSPMGGQAIPFLHRLGAELDPPGELTLRVLRERSRVVEQMLPFMLPGADLRKILREYFGDQFLFFPTSDRGLAATGGRAQAAYGVVEPLLWLLHMHGYRVLKGD